MMTPRTLRESRPHTVLSIFLFSPLPQSPPLPTAEQEVTKGEEKEAPPPPCELPSLVAQERAMHVVSVAA